MKSANFSIYQIRLEILWISKNLIKLETLHETDPKLSALNKIERRRKRGTKD